MTSAPTHSIVSQRILAPDVARGLMLLLIAMAYAGVYAGAGFGVDASDEPALDRGASLAATLFLDNRAFPLFAILFGYGLAWSVARHLSSGVESRYLRQRTRRRALLLLLFGFIHAFFVFPGEILASYGLALFLTGWLLFRSVKALRLALTLTGALYLVMVPLIMLAAAVAPGDGFAQSIPGYASGSDWIERLVNIAIGPIYVAIAYPLLFLVLLGYRAGRARLFENTDTRRSLLLVVAWAGVGISVVGALPAGLVLLGALHVESSAVGLFMGLQVLTGVAGGAGYAACFALGAEKMRTAWPSVTRAVAAVGKRSLTFYILNSVLVTLILHPELLGIGNQVGHFGALIVAALVWLLGVMLATILERADKRGPLETVMKRGLDGTRNR